MNPTPGEASVIARAGVGVQNPTIVNVNVNVNVGRLRCINIVVLLSNYPTAAPQTDERMLSSSSFTYLDRKLAEAKEEEGRVSDHFTG